MNRASPCFHFGPRARLSMWLRSGTGMIYTFTLPRPRPRSSGETRTNHGPSRRNWVPNEETNQGIISSLQLNLWAVSMVSPQSNFVSPPHARRRLGNLSPAYNIIIAHISLLTRMSCFFSSLSSRSFSTHLHLSLRHLRFNLFSALFS